MSARDPRKTGVDALTVKRGALPFLPTLVTAIVVAAVSLLCRPPSAPQAPAAPATAEAARAGSDGFHPAAEAPAAETLPAALAFARHQPLALQAMNADEARPGAARQARAASGRRACANGTRCGETRRAEAFKAPPPAIVRPAQAAATGVIAPPRPHAAPGAAEPEAAEPEGDEDGLPAGALPFAPAAAWADGLRRLGRDVAGETASLGGAVGSLTASVLPAVGLH